MTTKGLFRTLALACFLCSSLIACSTGKSESLEQPAKQLRPKLIAKHWRIDSTHLRQVYDGYIDVSWEKFKEATPDFEQIPKDEVNKLKSALTELLLETYNNRVRGMQLDFRVNGRYVSRYWGGQDAGVYRFNSSLDTLCLKKNGASKEKYLPVTFLSESELRVDSELPIFIEDTRQDFYRMEYKYIPVQAKASLR